MLDWDDVRFFLAIHRHGTLAGAAAALGLDATTVGRRLGRLERSVDARLFDRTPKGFFPTAAGQRLLVRAQQVEDQMNAALRDVEGEDQRPTGVVRLTVTEMLGTRFIAPHLHKFVRRHPGIRLELLCTNRELDLTSREADIALRLAKPERDDLVVKRLFSIELGLYAARSYLEECGIPTGEFAGHRVIRFADTRAFQRENDWLDENVTGAEEVLRSDSVSSIFSAACAGLGLALLPGRVADAEPLLVAVAVPAGPQPRVAWQAVHRDLAHVARIRAVTEFLGRIFAPRPAS